MKIKWLRAFLKFFLPYYILEKLSLGAAAAATLVILCFSLVLPVHALMVQTVLQSADWQKGSGHIKGATDQERNQAVEHQATLHLEFSSVLGFGEWLAVCLTLFAGTVPNTLGVPGGRTFWL